MNDWLQKVEEMKRQRAAAGSGIASSSATATPAANPFLNRPSTASTSSVSTTTTTNSTTSSSAGKPNPFLNRTGSTSGVGSATVSPAPSPTPTLHSATGSGSQAAGAEVGGGLYKTRFEQEQRRRQDLEHQLAAKERELASLKARLGSGGGGSGAVAARSSAGRTPEQIAAAKKRARMTRRQTARMSIHVGNTFDSVLAQIGGLDKRLRGAEAAKLQAEDKLLEIAIAKLEVDDLVEKVDTVLGKMIEQMDKFTVPQIKGMLLKVRSQTSKGKDEAEADARVSCRFSIIMPKGGGLQLPDAPAPPPVMLGGAAAVAKPTSFLEQIRKGQTLRNIDVSKLRQEQAQHREDAARTMEGMRSLEDTLKGALMQRMLDMNPDDEDDDGDFDDEEDW